jgi:hypothetical protein
MVHPDLLSLASCSLPSSTLCAGYAGGLRPCLTTAARDTAAEPGRGRKTVPLVEQRNIRRGQFLLSPRGQFRMSLDTCPDGVLPGRSSTATGRDMAVS